MICALIGVHLLTYWFDLVGYLLSFRIVLILVFVNGVG